MAIVKFIDLFAGIGGLRTGFEEACFSKGFTPKCVFTSEIKPHAITVLKDNFSHEIFEGDITKVEINKIPKFDFLLAGFPCQPFSSAGKGLGFVDTRGTLFFEIERILDIHKPKGFILENVEGLVKHDLLEKNDSIGRTLQTIIIHLEALGYNVCYKVLNSIDFGLPQIRKRIFIVGSINSNVDLENFPIKKSTLGDILEYGLPTLNTKFTKLLLEHYSISELVGKSIKDKRGGSDNIHSWDIELKGEVNEEQKILLNQMLKERRKKQWAQEIGIKWMDGMPLTEKQIRTFYNSKSLKSNLRDLVKKGYLVYEYPKKEVTEKTLNGIKKYRVPDTTLEKGYNIVAGKLSFEINKILDPQKCAPTLVATDMEKLAVPDGNGLRKMTLREGLRLFGFQENFVMNIRDRDGFDLLGNTVAIPVVKAVSERVLNSTIKLTSRNKYKTLSN